ncbi:MAG TPA: glycosyltransferase family 4 protein [Polyangia bacterium]|nr:glycosyltransferase family 4 protein [Polyangia bacterium]
MKIALICDWYAPRVGGIESQLVDLGRELRARGHEPHVITATRGLDEIGGVPVHRLDVPLLPGWDVIRDRSTLPVLERLVERHRFDVLHGHSLYSPLAHAAMRIAERRGLASVMTSHSLIDRAGIVLLRSLNRAGKWGAWPDVLTAVSTVAADEVRAASSRGEVLILPNGLDVRAWAAPPRAARFETEIVSVMRLNRRKRPLDLIRAIPRVIEGGLDGRVRFTVVGDGPLRGAMEREAERLGVRDHVDLVGSRPRHEVRRLLARADVFALPTVREAFGIALLEARAAGLPLVAMRGGGAGDLVEHGREGFLAETPAEFAAQLRRLAGDPSLRVRLGREAPLRLERFGWDAVIARHLDVYQLALERSRDRRAPARVRDREAA